MPIFLVSDLKKLFPANQSARYMSVTLWPALVAIMGYVMIRPTGFAREFDFTFIIDIKGAIHSS